MQRAERKEQRATTRKLVPEGFFAFEDLEVYQLAVDLVAQAYQLTNKFPDAERFGLTSQVRRAATSVTLNIAEGRGRGTDKDFARFLYQARGSLLEVVSAFHIAERLSFTSREQTQSLFIAANQLNSKLTAFIRKFGEDQ
jgi:four helix bundle protein